MMQLRSLSLTQFKNYAYSRFAFTQPVVAFTGPNGIGKTNLLDAIHYLCFTRSYFTATDAAAVSRGKAGFRIEGIFEHNGTTETVTVVLRENGKKEVSRNGIPYDKFSAHIGRFPCVVIAPDDAELITGGSEERRRFMDTLFAQTDSRYLENLIRYNKVLQQRNGYLRQCAQGAPRNDGLLDVLDAQLAEAGTYLHQVRKTQLPQLRMQVLDLYTLIAGKEEGVDLQYESHLLETPLEELLRRYREKDYLLQRTNAGVHKDELALFLQQTPFRNTASQGQRKSMLFSLKLAEAALLRRQKGFAPLLLLDDVFEKLDEQRMRNLLQHVCRPIGGQLFLTDTHPHRIQAAFGALQQELQVINLD
ncbi:MAG: DNA replication/repair protein RecF [Lacibacter sp.]